MAIQIDGEIFLNAREACRLLRVKPQTLYAYVSRGLLRSFRRGIARQRLYRQSEVEALTRLAPVRQPARPRIALPPLAETWVGDN